MPRVAPTAGVTVPAAPPALASNALSGLDNELELEMGLLGLGLKAVGSWLGEMLTRLSISVRLRVEVEVAV